MRRIILFATTFLFFTSLSNVRAQSAAQAVTRFIKLLDSNQQAETVFPFDIGERYNFHFVPMPRKGITFNEMNDAQKNAALGLVKICLSENAFKKTQQIMQLDAVLKILEQRRPDDHFRDTGNYHITVFGVPSDETIWGWRFEGHHISFTFSFDKQKMVAATPGFLGSNPAIVMEGPQKGEQVLKDETEAGFVLLHALDEAQLKKAIADTATPADIFTFDKRAAMIEATNGIHYGELAPSQQQLLLQLINLYVHRYTKLFADDMLKEIQKAGLENLRFVWMGHTKPGLGNPHYYRVQGPTFIIEYDNTQNNANHVHTVLRDLKHDFGGDELLEHYKAAHTN
ncbi:MAG TPA: DUF3500 domain-containing protein [Puia sp.]|nr:DUF3500 domain-containing protein [Puia sp.]